MAPHVFLFFSFFYLTMQRLPLTKRLKHQGVRIS